MKLSRFNLEELQIFRSTQKLAYDCVRAVEKQLKAGMTERDACALMKDDLRKRGDAVLSRTVHHSSAIARRSATSVPTPTSCPRTARSRRACR